MFRSLICLAVLTTFCNGLPYIEDKKRDFPEFVCPGFGYWPGGICSSEFYECVQDQFGDWIAHHFNCPPGTVYDPEILNCNHPQDVEECNDPKPTTQKPTTQPPTTQPPTTQPPTTQPPTTQPPTSQKPTTQKPTTQKPTTQKPTTQKPTTQKPTTQKPTTQKPTTTMKTTTKGPEVSTTLPASVNCQHEGLNPNPHQACSNVYFNCQLSSNGWNETILHCDLGMVFNPTTDTCDFIDNTEGCGDVYCKKEGFNPDIGSPRDCSVYFYCSDVPSFRSGWSITTCHCTNDLAFDPFLDMCTWPDTVPGCSTVRVARQRAQPDVCNAGLVV